MKDDLDPARGIALATSLGLAAIIMTIFLIQQCSAEDQVCYNVTDESGNTCQVCCIGTNCVRQCS